MADDKSKTGQDRKLIALNEPHEVRDCCKSFGCTKKELEAAVGAVGNSADQVRECLRRKA